MCYTIKQYDNRIAKIAALEAEKKRIEAEIDAIKKDIQSDMGDNEKVIGNAYRINWTHTESTRFDTKKFAAAHPKLYADKAYYTTTKSRRFSWSAI